MKKYKGIIKCVPTEYYLASEVDTQIDAQAKTMEELDEIYRKILYEDVAACDMKDYLIAGFLAAGGRIKE